MRLLSGNDEISRKIVGTSPINRVVNLSSLIGQLTVFKFPKILGTD